MLIFVLFWFKGIHSKFELCYLSSGRGFFLNDYQLVTLFEYRVALRPWHAHLCLVHSQAPMSP